MKISKKTLCLTAAFAIAVLTAAAQFASLSPAIDVIKDSMELKKCGVINCDVMFSQNDFDSSLTEKVEYVTISTLPDSSVGTLCLKDVPVIQNQTVSREDLGELRFVPAKDTAGNASFNFSDARDSSVSAVCTVNVLDEINLSPETADQTLTTQKNIAAFKFLMAADPENDSMTFNVVSYPKNGFVSLKDSSNGGFEYVPSDGYIGKDSFVYTATDVYGNTSAPAKVSIDVIKPASDVYFDDMKNHWAHNSAVEMAATGLMCGTDEDGKLMFYPESGISRGDFLAISLIMAGRENDIPEVSVTSFADDGSIPSNIKSYAEYALENGIISGYTSPDGINFKSTEPITRSQAAVIVDKLLSLPEISSDSREFSDASAVPDWANSSVCSLAACGILNGNGSGEISPESTLTKGQAAQMLCNVSDYLESRENEQCDIEKDAPKKNIFNLFGLLG